VKWSATYVTKTYRAGNHFQYDLHWDDNAVQTVSEVVLPSQLGPNLKYTFGYNGNPAHDMGTSVGWGELSSMTLPSGARADYQYEMDNRSGTQIQADWILKNSPSRKDLNYNLEYDNASAPAPTETWLYSIGEGAASITAPDGGVTSEWGDPVYKVQQPDGTVVERVWKKNIPKLPAGVTIWAGEKVNQYVQTEFTSISDASGTLVKTAIKEYSHDKNGNMTRTKEYDWVGYQSIPRDSFGKPTGALPAGTQLKRETVNAYHCATPDATDSTTSDPDAYNQPSAPSLRTALASSEVRDFGQTRLRIEYAYDNALTTGNLVETRTWDSQRGALLSPQPDGSRLDASNSIAVTNQYDQFGNLTSTTEPGRADGSRSVTRYVYGPVNGQSNLHPTTITIADGTPRARIMSREYDFWTGLLTRLTDADNNVTMATTYDVFGRPVQETAAEGRPEESRTVTVYSDVNRRVIVRADLNTTGDGKLITVRHFDQLGRIRLNRTLEDATAENELDETAGIKSQTRYAIDGTNHLNYKLVSRPYRAATSQAAAGEATMGWTVSTSDKGGRAVRVETFAGAAPPAPWGANAVSTGAVRTVYDADATTITDQNDTTKHNVKDVLGRLVEVREAPGMAGYEDYLTTYTYDVLGNLTQVAQGVQTRTFTYSSLSRMTSAFSPEQIDGQGTQVATTYAYHPNGSIASKTDPRGVQTTYTYDELNRIKTRDYSDTTPDVTYTYDTLTNGKGRLSSVVSSASAFRNTQYDALGRVKASEQETNGRIYTMGYEYDPSGKLRSQTYPSGRVVHTEYDSAGRVAGVRNEQTGQYYAGGASTDTTNRIRYTAHGAVNALKLGNSLWEHSDFNSRLQPVQIGLGTAAGTSNKLQLDFGYGPTDRDNGNVRSQTITVPGLSNPFVQAYDYDPLNRLQTAEETSGGAPQWKQVYGYDQFGNRTFAAGTTFPNPLDAANNPSISPNSNRITSSGFAYDAAGNLLCDPGHPCTPTAFYAYNAEGQMAGAGAASYAYDGDGRRVKKVVGSEVTVYVYNVSGQMIAEYSTQAATGGTSYLTQDHLGSTRLVTGQAGEVKRRYDYLPFGGELSVGRTSDYTGGTLKQQFTGHERDPETNLDFAQNRYYASDYGRFTTPDPSRGSVVPGNPQTWNRYAYALNNPLRYVDPLGLWGIEVYEIWEIYTYEENGTKVVIRRLIGYVIIVKKTKPKDNGERLLEQLGVDKKSAEGKRLLKVIGDRGQVLLANLGGEIGDFFKQVENLLYAQKTGTSVYQGGGPYDPKYRNCAETCARLAFPSTTNNPDDFMAPNTSDKFWQNQANIQGSELSFADAIRYGDRNNVNTHWASFVFREDDGNVKVFSRSGMFGPFELTDAAKLEGPAYGKIQGIGNDATGYYSRSIKRDVKK
jgi:RHS repeat-associated protein